MNLEKISGGALYIVSTPIGNLSDFSYRAVYILQNVDLIASEDTRTSGVLLSHYKITTPQTSYHEHNEKSKAPELIQSLLSGKTIALITDAGTPLISDPGYRLVNLAISNKLEVFPIPGASSILAALVVSGLPTDRFVFEGYLPRSSGRLKTFLSGLANEIRTLVLLETPHRIMKSLPVMLETLGDRNIVIARELTKKYEQKIRGPISEIIANLANKPIKGELVIIIPGHKAEMNA